ncbi:FecR family protein [Methylotenera sp. N17]|uniref:FecR family protein n=1 Tax=Methylotenera sp. N17 TaxID=1502761 RepID=UPI0006484EFF|nr:FecR domain-containing protein [Methylotenera sp. N17]
MHQAQQKKTLRETAISWFLRMQQVDYDHPDRGQFEAWLMMSPIHQIAYEEVAKTWEVFDSTEDLKSLDAAMEQKTFLDKKKRSNKITQSIGSLLAITLIAFASLFAYRSWQAQPIMEVVKVADIGQIKNEVLDDGTKLNLNANSELEITYFRDRRVAKLKRGEVIFDVARDESRPFIVDSGYGRITVLGTKFAVNRLQKLIRVSVDHGKVQVDALDTTGASLSAPLVITNGQVAEVHQNHPPTRTNQLASDAFSFTDGIITFDKAGLEEIAETLSRYRQPQVSVQMPLTSDAEITAVINKQDVEKFIANLPNMASVGIEKSPNQTLIRQSKN